MKFVALSQQEQDLWWQIEKAEQKLLEIQERKGGHHA